MLKAASGASIRRAARGNGRADAPDDADRRPCDHKGCGERGVYRAPMAPERLRDYYWFCLQHVREYNRAWNYCAGKSEADIEAQIRSDTVGWRPTWPLGRLGGGFARARFDRMRDGFGLFEDERTAASEHRAGGGARGPRDPAADEREACDVMGLSPPLTVAALKACYIQLVKRHHPDANGGDKAAEERLKLINQAYALLKQRLGV
jgi:hypothetical protein